MPTFGWILEGREEHQAGLFDPVDPSPSGGPRSQRSPCPFCERTFDDDRAWGQHLAVDHPIEPPVLLVDGLPFWKAGSVRRPLAASSVSTANASLLRVGDAGGELQSVDVRGLRAALSRARHGVLEVELVNVRNADGATSSRRTLLRFEVPKPSELRAVEEIFVERLARDALSMDAVMEFRRVTQRLGAPRYRAALGDFAMAIAARSGDPHSTLGTTDAEHKLRTTAETLTDFVDRPVARTVLVTSRLALCDAASPFPATGVPELDRASHVLRALVGDATLTRPSVTKSSSEQRPMCPVDPRTADLVATLAALRVPTSKAVRDRLRRIALDGDRRASIVAMSALLRVNAAQHDAEARTWRRAVSQDRMFARYLESDR